MPKFRFTVNETTQYDVLVEAEDPQSAAKEIELMTTGVPRTTVQPTGDESFFIHFNPKQPFH